MSTPRDTRLPAELDFGFNPEASAARMNLAMLWIAGQLTSVLALKPEFDSALDQLQAVGLQRLTAALAPVLAQAQVQGAAIDDIYQQWIADGVLVTMKAQILAAVTAEIGPLETLLSAGAANQVLSATGDADAPNAWIDPYTTAQAEAERWFFYHG